MPDSKPEDILAVLIDADNASPEKLPIIMRESIKLGIVRVKRIYGDFSGPGVHNKWKKDVVLEHGFNPIMKYAYSRGKNSTDIALMLDAMDLLYSNKFTGFCLVSSDSDFTGLAMRLREAGVKVYGFGESKTPKPFVSVCDKFITLDRLEDVSESPSALSPVADGSPETVKPEPSRSKAKEIADLKETLKSAIKEKSGEDEWASLSEVGSFMLQLDPSFDCRKYGSAKLSKLIKLLEIAELNESSTKCRLKE